MKKILGLLMFLMVFGVSSVAGAYSYSFTFIDGGLNLNVAENCDKVTLTTTDDLVVDMAFDLPTEDLVLDYVASIDLQLVAFNFFPIDLEMTDLNLGSMGVIDPSGFIGDGQTAKPYNGFDRIDAAFGGYAMTDVLFEYDVTITPDASIDDRYAIHIADLSISEGNTSEVFSGILSELTGSGMVPDVVLPYLIPPFEIDGSLSGSIDIQANPVPVPGAAWLMGAGLIGLVGLRRRK